MEETTHAAAATPTTTDAHWRGVASTEVRWRRTLSDIEQYYTIKLWDDNGELLAWEVATYPWWLDVERMGENLRLWVRHEGLHRGVVKLAVGDWADSRFSVQVQAQLTPTPEAAAKGARVGGAGAALGVAGALVFSWLFFGPWRPLLAVAAGAVGPLVYWLGYLLTVVAGSWLPGAAWGWLTGGRQLAWKAGLASITGLLLGALVGFNGILLLPAEMGAWRLLAIGLIVPSVGALSGWMISRVLEGGPWLTRRCLTATAGGAVVGMVLVGVLRPVFAALLQDGESGSAGAWLGVSLGLLAAAVFWGAFLGGSLGRPTSERKEQEEKLMQKELAAAEAELLTDVGEAL